MVLFDTLLMTLLEFVTTHMRDIFYTCSILLLLYISTWFTHSPPPPVKKENTKKAL